MEIVRLVRLSHKAGQGVAQPGDPGGKAEIQARDLEDGVDKSEYEHVDRTPFLFWL